MKNNNGFTPLEKPGSSPKSITMLKKLYFLKTVNSPNSLTGFTLIEVLTAIVLISIGIMSSFSLIQKVASFTLSSTFRFTAAYLVQEGIELARNIKDTNLVEIISSEDAPTVFWDDGIFCCQPPPYYCPGPVCSCECQGDFESQSLREWVGDGDFLKINDEDFFQYSGGRDTLFKRKIIVEKRADEENRIMVKVIVTWQERGETRQVAAWKNLYNWYWY